MTAHVHANVRDDGPPQERCAIAFWGLPRAFESLVLPSLVQNVIRPNAQYECDYFVHFYELDQEAGGRSGGGGTLNVKEIYQLEQAVHNEHEKMQQFQQAGRRKTKPLVEFTFDKEEDFWTRYKSLLDKIHDTKDDKGKPLYFPFKALTYQFPTTIDNIIKMWHSIERAWDFMQESATSNHVQYTHIAMLRSDVLYMTSIDIMAHPNQAVIPGFGRHPVSDRIVIGPAKAVQIWAKGRFSRLDDHVEYMRKNEYGWGMQSERFMFYTLYPAMREVLPDPENAIYEDKEMCFFRARADESVWVSDCNVPNTPKQTEKRDLVAKILGRPCHGKGQQLPDRKAVKSLDCHREVTA